MFSNHTNINILGSAIDEAEVQLCETTSKAVNGKFARKKPSYIISNQDLLQQVEDEPAVENEKLNFQFINYKNQQIL